MKINPESFITGCSGRAWASIDRGPRGAIEAKCSPTPAAAGQPLRSIIQDGSTPHLGLRARPGGWPKRAQGPLPQTRRILSPSAPRALPHPLYPAFPGDPAPPPSITAPGRRPCLSLLAPTALPSPSPSTWGHWGLPLMRGHGPEVTSGTRGNMQRRPPPPSLASCF